MSAPRIRRILVVVPARDEVDTIAACLASVDAAAALLARRAPRVAVRVVVAADACTDGTAEAAAAAGAEVVEVAAASVGAARAAGVARGLARWHDDLAATWVASTDADSAVPATWLLDHLAAAATGAELLIGRVIPYPDHLPAAALEAWHEAHASRPVGGSVHGANLGVRADALEAVGGFGHLPLHEDVDLVARLRAAGARVDDLPRPPVVTSGRTRSRVEGGFASYLAALPGAR
ncbi:glycosyltransferase [Agrococcus carbonis]|uniref:4,4'-diaponeurosporenoate glycosyltransferase n=1 Tax=Agrococcus carbonis TaxID=684552 RepID=A0A1H1N6K8_9MICO|nr:glycosyltransferase [Agrococcus carbonis]SDR94510.1 Glycosyl transferase family 2 [Agrococcus carbonis]